jgi:hypothetical protein
MSRSAGGQCTVYTLRVARQATGAGTDAGTGIGARVAQGSGKWKTGWMQLRSNFVFFCYFTDPGRGEDLMEGGRGVLPPHKHNTVGRYCMYLMR